MRYFYVICPVGSDPRFGEKKSALTELGSAFDIEPFFPLERHNQFSVALAANEMRHAEFVLADLSLERPSCYFELGIAQAVGAEVFIIAKSSTTIHQAGDSKKITFYFDLAEYRLQISQILANCSAVRSSRT